MVQLENLEWQVLPPLKEWIKKYNEHGPEGLMKQVRKEKKK